MKNLKTIFIAIIAMSIITSCSEDSLDPNLHQKKTVKGSIKSTSDVKAVLYGAYNRMSEFGYYGRNCIIFNEVRTDNVFANGNSGRFIQPGGFKLLTTSGYATNTWTQMYKVIASANIIIAVDGSTLIGDLQEFNHFKGQALTIRALAHFDGLKLFGQQHVGGTLGIPYITKYKGDDLFPSRLTVEETKNAIIKDLKDAKLLMNSTYDDSLSQLLGSVAPDALLSRVYLYFGMWEDAKVAAKNVIDTNKYSVMSEAGFVSSFATDGSNNTIFALANSSTDNAGINGLGFIYKGSNYGDIEVLANAEAIFEAGDVRGQGGILGMEGTKIRNIGKFTALNGYDDTNIIRYEEIILNYAEALWRINNNDSNVLTQLNLITAQRGASTLTSVDLNVILNERRKELMFEGFRFDDLMRNGMDISKIDSNQGFTSTIPYGNSRLAFPIPNVEINANSNMVQNKGY